MGGLADFAAGLVGLLRRDGVEVEIVLPDYGSTLVEVQEEQHLTVPDWAAPATIRKGILGGVGVSLVEVPGIAKPNPYVDAAGRGWADNDKRFLGFSAAVAALATLNAPEVLHLNDWHTAGVLGFLDDTPPTVLTIHNLAYQGETGTDWLGVFTSHTDAYEFGGKTNPLAGGIALADRVVTVSPTFASESLPPAAGFGLAELLASRGDSFSGILNGIDTEVWNPSTDPYLDHHYDVSSFPQRLAVRSALLADLGWADNGVPLVGMVTRLTEQKGIDLALRLVPELERLRARMVLLGSGDKDLADAASAAAAEYPDYFVFENGYDERLAHRVFGGSDLYLMPSRFEPAGLTQMQAMRYGSIPVVTDVGGLHDTVIDADSSPDSGTGFVAGEVTVPALLDALDRAVQAWRSPERRTNIARRGMTRDWSWTTAAASYRELYAEVTSAR